MKTKYEIIFFTNWRDFGDSDSTSILRVPFLSELADQIDGKGQILVVNHPVSLMNNPSRNIGRLARIMRGTGHKKIKDNLNSYTPVIFAGLRVCEQFPVVGSMVRYCLKKSILNILKKLNFENTALTVIVSHPFHRILKGMVGESSFIYHCADDFALFEGGGNDKLIRDSEIKMLPECDFVLCTAKRLVEKIQPYNKNTYYFPNAVEFSMFNRAAQKDYPVADELTVVPRPVIGFTGVLSDRCDLALIYEMVARRPEWSFVFIGEERATSNPDEYANKLNKLKDMPNTYFLGWKKYGTLPGYLKGFDAAVMPYKLNELLASVSPNKMFQYMASGVPIFSTPLQEVLEYREIIDVASTADEFIGKIELRLRNKNEGRIKKQIVTAKEESWENRSKELLKKLDSIRMKKAVV